jgi:hypothetical protein
VTTELLSILIVGAAAAGWALLNALGAERQRMLVDLEAKRPRTPLAPPSPLPERPVVVKPQGKARLASTTSASASKGSSDKSDKAGAKSDKAGAKSSKSKAKSASRH